MRLDELGASAVLQCLADCAAYDCATAVRKPTLGVISRVAPQMNIYAGGVPQIADRGHAGHHRHPAHAGAAHAHADGCRP